MKKKEECGTAIPLNSSELIGDFMANNSLGDRTLLPTVFRFFGCLASGLSLLTEQQSEEDESDSPAYKKK